MPTSGCVRLDKPIGTLLLLWPTLSALWIAARGEPPLRLVLIFTMGTILMRSAGCAFNDWADRDFDAHVKRTAQRPLATGEIAPWEALVVGAVLALCAFAVRAVDQPRRRSCCRSRRWRSRSSIRSSSASSSLPQAFLGIAFSFGIPMAYAAVQNRQFRRSPGGCSRSTCSG